MGAQMTEEVSQMGFSVPGNVSTQLKGEVNTRPQNPSTQLHPTAADAMEKQSALNNFDIVTPNNQLKAVGVTRPIYNAQISHIDGQDPHM